MKRWVVGVLLVGCTLGVRAQGPFAAEIALDDARMVAVDLPSTPLRVTGCDAAVPESCPAALTIEGRWHAVGATRDEARAHASTPSLVYSRGTGVLRLSAEVPLEVDGLVDLEVDEVGLPSDLDLEVRTSTGDIEVRAMRGSVVVDTDNGDVDLAGPMRSASVWSGHGGVTAEVEGPVDITAVDGGVFIEQRVAGQAVNVHAPRGDVTVWLASDADLDLMLEAGGRIVVQTDALSAQTRGLYRGRSGTGEAEIRVVAGGDVEVRLRGAPTDG